MLQRCYDQSIALILSFPIQVPIDSVLTVLRITPSAFLLALENSRSMASLMKAQSEIR